MLKHRILLKQDEEFMTKEEEKSDSDSEESSEYEEYSDSEEETGDKIIFYLITLVLTIIRILQANKICL